MKYAALVVLLMAAVVLAAPLPRRRHVNQDDVDAASEDVHDAFADAEDTIQAAREDERDAVRDFKRQTGLSWKH